MQRRTRGETGEKERERDKRRHVQVAPSPPSTVLRMPMSFSVPPRIARPVASALDCLQHTPKMYARPDVAFLRALWTVRGSATGEATRKQRGRTGIQCEALHFRAHRYISQRTQSDWKGERERERASLMSSFWQAGYTLSAARKAIGLAPVLPATRPHASPGLFVFVDVFVHKLRCDF